MFVVPPDPCTDSGKKVKKHAASRAAIWLHYTRLPDDPDRASCNYCGTSLGVNSSRNGTSSLNNHAKICKKCAIIKSGSRANQSELSFQLSADGSTVIPVPWQYNEEEVRAAFARMIVVDELPFIFSEKEGFRYFMSKACPRFHIPSGTTVYRDVISLYAAEKAKLKKYFMDSHQTVSLTTDTWISAKLQNYMVLTAHYIDSDWKLNKKIISFVLVDSHKGEAIGKALDKLVIEWGIETVCSITVDNASSNDTCLLYMKSSLKNRGGAVAKGSYLHMRCVAHIVNLVVQDGLKIMSHPVQRIRNAVKYVRSSTARMTSFKNRVTISKVNSKGHLSLDVCTRWNSTFLMLETAVTFERAFDQLRLQDPSYKEELDLIGADGETGPPTHDDWVYASEFKLFLQHFYELTKKVSGTNYVTSNTFFEEVAAINYLLDKWSERVICGDDEVFKNMAIKMKDKYDKYWGDPEKMNKYIFIAAILDPRIKEYDFFKDTIQRTYGVSKGNRIWSSAHTAFVSLFGEYKILYGMKESIPQPASSDCASESSTPQSDPMLMRALYNKRMKLTDGDGSRRTEIDKYLAEDVEENSPEFNVLTWWKCNSLCFPILSRMAHDILVIPISTVTSESAFSTSGRILDAFRSSLTPMTLQALICTQDWLRRKRINIEAHLEELSKLEEGVVDLQTSSENEDLFIID